MTERGERERDRKGQERETDKGIYRQTIADINIERQPEGLRDRLAHTERHKEIH